MTTRAPVAENNQGLDVNKGQIFNSERENKKRTKVEMAWKERKQSYF